jgi:hypothetical protein
VKLTNRALQKARQEAWKKLNHDYKNEAELCFALGFEAGYNAVAPRVEPRLSESGGGFESRPALRVTDFQKNIDAAFSNSGAQIVCRKNKSNGSYPVRVFLPKQWGYFLDYLFKSLPSRKVEHETKDNKR